MDALKRQEGGAHYLDFEIPPSEFVHRNKIPYLEGSVIYYVLRWRKKNGLADLRKAIHTLELIIELEQHGERGEVLFDRREPR